VRMVSSSAVAVVSGSGLVLVEASSFAGGAGEGVRVGVGAGGGGGEGGQPSAIRSVSSSRKEDSSGTRGSFSRSQVRKDATSVSVAGGMARVSWYAFTA